MESQRHLFNVEQELPKEKRARKALVRHFVVLASDSAEAIKLAKEESLSPDGRWAADRADGVVLQLRSTTR